MAPRQSLTGRTFARLLPFFNIAVLDVGFRGGPQACGIPTALAPAPLTENDGGRSEHSRSTRSSGAGSAKATHLSFHLVN